VGQRCKHPQRNQAGWSPAAKRFFVHFESKIASGCNSRAVFFIFTGKNCCIPVGDASIPSPPLDPPLDHALRSACGLFHMTWHVILHGEMTINSCWIVTLPTLENYWKITCPAFTIYRLLSHRLTECTYVLSQISGLCPWWWSKYYCNCGNVSPVGPTRINKPSMSQWYVAIGLRDTSGFHCHRVTDVRWVTDVRPTNDRAIKCITQSIIKHN